MIDSLLKWGANTEKINMKCLTEKEKKSLKCRNIY